MWNPSRPFPSPLSKSSLSTIPLSIPFAGAPAVNAVQRGVLGSTAFGFDELQMSITHDERVAVSTMTVPDKRTSCCQTWTSLNCVCQRSSLFGPSGGRFMREILMVGGDGDGDKVDATLVGYVVDVERVDPQGNLYMSDDGTCHLAG